jgi:GxxExxY protein
MSKKMKEKIEQQKVLNDLSEKVIGAAFEVSNVLGPGFLEKVYENALAHELSLRGIPAAVQQKLRVMYKDQCVGDYMADLLIQGQLLVELKCVEDFAPEHAAQCLNYLRATGLRLALLLNFQKPRLQIKRIIL